MKAKKTEIRDRDIIDDIVVKNKERDPKVFQSIQSIPFYFGMTDNKPDTLHLRQTKRRKEFGKQSLICDIISGTESLQLEDGEGTVVLLDEDGKKRSVNVHPTIIKFIKTCIAGSLTENSDYNKVVSSMAKGLLEVIEHINLPIPLPADTKLQKLVGDELNDYLKKLCDETGTRWSEVITAKKVKKKTGKDLLLSAAKESDV